MNAEPRQRTTNAGLSSPLPAAGRSPRSSAMVPVTALAVIVSVAATAFYLVFFHSFREGVPQDGTSEPPAASPTTSESRPAPAQRNVPRLVGTAPPPGGDSGRTQSRNPANTRAQSSSQSPLARGAPGRHKATTAGAESTVGYVGGGPGGATVYSEADPEVLPPQLIRPQLPREPTFNVGSERLGAFEVVVGPSGVVEHVRLISPSNRFAEKMLISAVKAWVFRPATKAGQPVRYRLRIPMTQ